ncbi:MAG: hypothetical protein LBU31_01730 [Coriobacteriales bacterium]|jgi:hypothetical protein|nr:hypothetical protein [Coriobacteriales bacterium]
MSQESNPRFSHITVGQVKADNGVVSEDEEVIAIGAVDAKGVASAPQSEGDVTAPLAASNPGSAAVRTSASEDKRSPEDSAAPDEDFGGPMSLPYKIVASACGVGVIIVIAYLVNYYWIAPH